MLNKMLAPMVATNGSNITLPLSLGIRYSTIMECLALWEGLYNISGSGQSAVSILF